MTTDTPRTIDAWTAAQLAAAADAPNITELEAETMLDTATAEGYCVRLTSGTATLYIGAHLGEVLETLGAMPVDPDEVARMRDRIYSGIQSARSRAQRLAQRAARQGDRDA